jgi:large conductance mechanosensitive channel
LRIRYGRSQGDEWVQAVPAAGNLIDTAVGIVIADATRSVKGKVQRPVVHPSEQHVPVRRLRQRADQLLLIAAVLYYLIFAPYARFRARFEAPPAPASEVTACPRCLSEIPLRASRCAFCAAEAEPGG